MRSRRSASAIEETSALTRSLRVSGTVAQIEAAFQPGLARYRNAEQGEFRGREGELQIPAELDGLITGVFGFDERRVAAAAIARRRSALEQRRSLPPSRSPRRSSRPTTTSRPATGAGQTVAIAEFGGGYFADDLAAFCAKQGTRRAEGHARSASTARRC